MKTYIIDDFDTIVKITGKNVYKKIILHINDKKREVKYESDYTLFELTERLDYNKTRLLVANI